MPIGSILLLIAAILVHLGPAERVLDRLGMTDRAALVEKGREVRQAGYACTLPRNADGCPVGRRARPTSAGAPAPAPVGIATAGDHRKQRITCRIVPAPTCRRVQGRLGYLLLPWPAMHG